jgi:SAM-dependent methyltransferase
VPTRGKRLVDRLVRPLTFKQTRRRLDRFILANASPGKTLDIGSNDGPHAVHFPNRVAMDVFPGSRVNVVGDAHHLPFSANCFDVVLLAEVLEHLVAPQQALDECRRVLRPGGRLVLSTRFMFPLHESPHDYFRFTRYGLAMLLSTFVDVRIQEEATGIDTLAILVQRMGIQAETLGWRPFRYGWLVAARVLPLFRWLITKEFGDGVRRATVEPVFVSGYYVTAQKSGSPDESL